MERIKKHVGTHHITSWKVFVFVLAIILAGVLGTSYSIEAYPQVFKTEIGLENRENINPADPVIVNFSQPVMSARYSENIKIIPEAAASFTWENSGKKLVITPENFWRPETNYKVTLPAGMNVMLAEIPAQDLAFSTVEFPKVVKISPAPEAKDVVLDIEDPIILNFNQSTEGFYFKFNFTPEDKLSFKFNDDKTEVKLLPQDKIKAGENYKLVVYAKYIKDSDEGYREIYRSSFATLAPPPTSWNKNLSDRVEEAKKYTQAKITTGKYIDINLSAQVLSFFEDGKLLVSSLISSGKRGMDTPKGEYKILTKRPRPWSKKYALYMPWFMGFTTQGHGIHELPEWPGGYKEGANHLGIPVSHGCVRLGIGPAKEIYDWTDVGTPVVIY